MAGINLVKGVVKEFSGIRTSIKAGARVARQNNKSIFSGAALGAKQVYKHVGAAPIITGIAAAVTVPVPGACATGIVLGTLAKKGVKALAKLFK